MCIFGNNQARPQAPAVAPAPTAGSVMADNDNSKTIEATKKAVATRQGVFGNIRTSAQGDAGFGFSSLFGGKVASFGRGKRAA
jgi:hypothetical protein